MNRPTPASIALAAVLAAGCTNLAPDYLRPALPAIESARLGRLPVPPALVGWALEQASAVHPSGGLATLASMTIQQVQMRHGQLDLAYAWGADAPARMLAALLPAQEHQRLRAYAAELAKTTASLDPAQPVSLSQLLPPMFELARRRTAQGGAGALENRAALMVLGMVANGIGLSVLLPERGAELDRRPITLTLTCPSRLSPPQPASRSIRASIWGKVRVISGSGSGWDERSRRCRASPRPAGQPVRG